MVMALRSYSPTKGKVPKLNMLELVTVANNRYKKFKLRRRAQPKAFCYVCSRVDPSGIFRNPNSHLFRQGFFHACEHFPKAPYSTFVGEDVHLDIRDGNDDADVVTSRTGASISVTIKQGSSVGKTGTSSKRERTFGSSVDRHASRQSQIVSRSLDEKHFKRIDDSGLRLPPLPGTKGQTQDIETGKRVSPLALSVFPVGKTDHSKSRGSGDLKGQRVWSRNIKTSTTDTANPTGVKDPSAHSTSRITIIPTALEDYKSSPDDQSIVTDTSVNTHKTKLSKDADPQSGVKTKHSAASNRTACSHRSHVDALHMRPYINESDGLDPAFAVQPLVREIVVMDGSQSTSRARDFRSKGRAGDRTHRHGSLTTDTLDSASEMRPESGHLRYHHRVDEDSVPDPGFEIPPTPSEQELLEFERMEQERIEQERLEIEKNIAMGNVFDDGSSKGFPESLSDDSSLRLLVEDGASRPLETRSSFKSMCRCSSFVRELSLSHTTCKKCGKIVRQGSEQCGLETSRQRSQTEQEGRSSLGSLASRSRQKMLLEGRRGKIKTVTDEDYMDLESIIHEDDGHYWSSDDETGGGTSERRSSIFRYRNAKPFPLVDPDIHKLVYIKALHKAREKRTQSEDRLRRPNVFSYYQLWPFAGKNNNLSEYIGIRPDDSVMPKKGQLMKHVFGDVKLDEFYSDKRQSKKTPKVINDAATGTSKTTAKDTERSSVSLKMMRQ